ncbi:MAG: biotin--[acetyl-CoA-carboxylase] ligase [Nitrospirae bacterium]|nr:biotin--[acetyl-CoA-carboxylase] ligase [Nitrospirota bacterium]
MDFEEGFNADWLQNKLNEQSSIIGRKIIFLKETGSTNEFADNLVKKGSEEGTVVIADSQTAGIGRHGRSWFSPPGKNLYVSVILKHPLPVNKSGLLSLMAAVASCSALNKFASLKTGIKWPNDVLCNERKLGGILTTLKSSGDFVKHAVLGIGLNINISRDEFPEEISATTTSARIETGAELSRKDIARELLANIDFWYKKLTSGEEEDIISTWTKLSITLGKKVTAKTADGFYSGIAEAIDDKGMLLIRLDDNSLKKISSGEIINLR